MLKVEDSRALDAEGNIDPNRYKSVWITNLHISIRDDRYSCLCLQNLGKATMKRENEIGTLVIQILVILLIHVSILNTGWCGSREKMNQQWSRRFKADGDVSKMLEMHKKQ
ncbi:hypothetical protein C5167_016496 [Papaver somniferum]|nr:hypothetical protein C5167_016496 [Papaver somniferum]